MNLYYNIFSCFLGAWLGLDSQGKVILSRVETRETRE